MTLSEQVIASIIYDGRSEMSVAAFRAASPTGGLSCLSFFSFCFLSRQTSRDFISLRDSRKNAIRLHEPDADPQLFSVTSFCCSKRVHEFKTVSETSAMEKNQCHGEDL